MFLTYIEFFHKLHTKHLKRFSNKIQLMYTHISSDIKFDETIEMNKSKKKDEVDDSTPSNGIKISVEEVETNNILDDEESVKLINDILENSDHNSGIHNNTPTSKSSNDASIFHDETQINDENVFSNFKNISESCDNLLSKHIENLTAIALTNNTDNKATTEISDISDDISVMSEVVIDEHDNKPTFTVAKSKATRGRKKKK